MRYLGVTIIHGKIRYNNGHRQSYRQHTGQGTKSAHKHPDVRFGHHIAVSYCCHSDQRPPQPQRYTFEIVVWVRLYPFRVVYQTGKYHYTYRTSLISLLIISNYVYHDYQPNTRKNTSRVSSLAEARNVWMSIFKPEECLVSLNSLMILMMEKNSIMSAFSKWEAKRRNIKSM